MEMLQLNDLHKTFNPGTVNEKVALNGVSLQMEAGDFATIVGSNGAGKSTLFNAITGGFIADEGSILLGGQDITFAPEHQRSKVIGHLFQDPLKGTAPNMTIEENLALAYLRAGTAPNAIFSRTQNDVIITLGAKGAYYRTASSAGYVPGIAATQIDTIGAGDSHIGAVIACEQLGRSLPESIRIANRIAAKVVETSGALLSEEAFQSVDFD